MAMTLDRVHPDLRVATRRLTRLPMPPRALVRILVRRLPVPDLPGVEVRRVEHAGVGMRVYLPEVRRSSGALLWIHGGGMVIGDARQDEALCGSTADRLGVVVVSTNYRLAPEHPFPAALDDVHAAWRWVQTHTRALGVDRGLVAVGGESAGGGLAATLVQRLHDEGGVQPVAQWLFAPMLDDRTAARRELDETAHLVWNNTSNLDGWSAYLGYAPGTAEPPRYAVGARREDLRDLPPAFLAWGDIELFAEEDGVYADRLRAAGVGVTVEVVEGAPHGFESWARTTAPARALTARAQDWLGTRFGTDGS